MYLQINTKDSQTLIKQVYEGIKKHILTGNLLAKQKLPSTRQLAKELKLSRNIILESYEQLSAEGYIETIKGSGTYVASHVVLENYHEYPQMNKENLLGLRNEPNQAVIDFRTGVPSLSLFPKDKWGLLYKHICEDLLPPNLDYYEPRGCYQLRYVLSQYLRRVRGVICDPSTLLVTTGAAQSFNLLAKYFSSINKKVITENPLSHGIVDILKENAMQLYPIAVDDSGMNTSLLPAEITPGLIFTTPSHQFPTGSILPIKRRIELIRYAREKSCYIVEDDYDSEFRFEGAPIQCMQSLDPEQVIYVGTFSKILCPALRIGYMVLPSHLVDAICNLKYIEDIHSPVLEQLTLAQFIEEGYLDSHIRKAKKFYKRKNELVINTLYKKFNNHVVIKGSTAGIHLLAKFPKIRFTTSLLSNLEQNGLKIPVVKAHAVNESYPDDELLIGYGNLSDDEILQGITILYHILKPFYHK